MAADLAGLVAGGDDHYVAALDIGRFGDWRAPFEEIGRDQRRRALDAMLRQSRVDESCAPRDLLWIKVDPAVVQVARDRLAVGLDRQSFAL